MSPWALAYHPPFLPSLVSLAGPGEIQGLTKFREEIWSAWRSRTADPG
jgi:hypothetical protein